MRNIKSEFHKKIYILQFSFYINRNSNFFSSFFIARSFLAIFFRGGDFKIDTIIFIFYKMSETLCCYAVTHTWRTNTAWRRTRSTLIFSFRGFQSTVILLVILANTINNYSILHTVLHTAHVISQDCFIFLFHSTMCTFPLFHNLFPAINKTCDHSYTSNIQTHWSRRCWIMEYRSRRTVIPSETEINISQANSMENDAVETHAVISVS